MSDVINVFWRNTWIKKLLFFLLFFLSCNCLLLAQEVLSPLKFNAALTAKRASRSSSLNYSFVYSLDTMHLPFQDDFSNNHFKPYNAKVTDPNVKDSVWYHLMIGNGLSPLNSYMADTTYRFVIDTIPGYGFDSIAIDTIPLSSVMIDVYDLNAYPVTFFTEELWPAYSIFDTLWTPQTLFDTLFEISPDYTQDSLTIYFVATIAADSNYYWQDDFAFHNYNYPVNAKSIGVATLDGLDNTGYPYNWSSSSAHDRADVLTSMPIFLGNKPGGGTYSFNDQLALTFKYQPGGLGENPDANDSLVVEFWSPDSARWYYQWGKKGFVSDQFHNAMIPISAMHFLQNGFKFRFSNFGSLTGSLDHWHIDYVQLKVFNTDTIPNDLAYSKPFSTLLKDYTAMPWNHYVVDSTQNLIATLTPLLHNNNNAGTKPADNNELELFLNGTSVGISYGQDNVANTVSVNPGSTNNSMWYTIKNQVNVSPSLGDTSLIFDVRAKFDSPDGNDWRDNDTLKGKQVFYNYYSYDDGSAEWAYGLEGLGAQLAYKFTLPGGITDTIRAIQAHFVSSVHDMSQAPFFLQIWNDDNGKPGSLIYTTDDQDLPQFFTPQYHTGVNGFVEYFLPQKVVVSGTYYIGWKQSTTGRLNVGFDRNNNNKTKIFYNLGSTWQNTGFEGSLLLRPVFVNDRDALFAKVEEVKIKKKGDLLVYPVPTRDILYVVGDDGLEGYAALYDLQGKMVASKNINQKTTLDVGGFPDGIYLLRIIGNNREEYTRKIVIQR